MEIVIYDYTDRLLYYKNRICALNKRYCSLKERHDIIEKFFDSHRLYIDAYEEERYYRALSIERKIVQEMDSVKIKIDVNNRMAAEFVFSQF